MCGLEDLGTMAMRFQPSRVLTLNRRAVAKREVGLVGANGSGGDAV